MKLDTTGIVLSLRPFNERDAVAHIFTADYGLMVGMLRGTVVAKKNKILVGQCGNVSWGARLDDMLGVFHFESSINLSVPCLSNPAALSCMSAAFALLAVLLPERVMYGPLYHRTVTMLTHLGAPGGDPGSTYLAWEVYLLQELGYALDLSRCGGCGRSDDLTYLSPNTGRAVCASCGAPYASRLFTLPIDLRATAFFLGKIMTEQGGGGLPLLRRLVISD